MNIDHECGSCIWHICVCGTMSNVSIWHASTIWYIFNCNWVANRWQLFSTHVHTNYTVNVTEQTIHRTTQKYIEQHKKIHW